MSGTADDGLLRSIPRLDCVLALYTGTYHQGKQKVYWLDLILDEHSPPT